MTNQRTQPRRARSSFCDPASTAMASNQPSSIRARNLVQRHRGARSALQVSPRSKDLRSSEMSSIIDSLVCPLVKRLELSRQPSGEYRLMHASKVEQAQPLIDIGDKDHVARHPVGKLRMVERCVRMHGAEYARMQVCLHPGLDRIGDHQIGLSLGQRIEDCCVVLPKELSSLSADAPYRSARWCLLD